MEQLLKKKYGDSVIAHTLPPVTAKNVSLAGTRHPVTGIAFDKSGFPIFDGITRIDTKIVGDLGKMRPEAHMRAATRQLREDILAGKIDRKMFSDLEWLDIKGGHERIGEYTWHHHQDRGRMQLVPTEIHKWIKHLGGNKL